MWETGHSSVNHVTHREWRAGPTALLALAGVHAGEQHSCAVLTDLHTWKYQISDMAQISIAGLARELSRAHLLPHLWGYPHS